MARQQANVSRAASWLAAVVVTALLAGPAGAAESVEARIARLERQLDSQTLVEMVTRLDRLEQEVQQLRGQVEEQSHTIADLRQRQRDLYLDIDRRLGRLERESAGTSPQAAVPPVAAPVPTTVEAELTAAPAPPPAAVAVAPAAAPPATPAVPASTGAVAAEQEREAYQQAFDQLRDLRYEQAIAAFREFLQKFPEGRYGHIAQYWIGEANYAQRNFAAAIIDYQTLLQRYPRSPKLAEAMLKVGYSQYELGDKAAASKTLTELTQTYPDTTEAGQAHAFLQKMRGEGQ